MVYQVRFAAGNCPLKGGVLVETFRSVAGQLSRRDWSHEASSEVTTVNRLARDSLKCNKAVLSCNSNYSRSVGEAGLAELCRCGPKIGLP